MLLIRACGYGECRILPVSIPGNDRSSAYLPWPVVLPAESTSATRFPIMEKSDIFFKKKLGKFKMKRPHDIGRQRVFFIFLEFHFHRSINCSFLHFRRTIFGSSAKNILYLISIDTFMSCPSQLATGHLANGLTLQIAKDLIHSLQSMQYSVLNDSWRSGQVV
jgi:hypothetical protein